MLELAPAQTPNLPIRARQRNMIDWLRTSVGAHPGWWSLAFNAVFCTIIGTSLSLARSGSLTTEPVVISFSVGFSIYACMFLGHVCWSPRLPRLLVTILMLACGLVLGLAAGGALTEGRPLMLLRSSYPPLAGALLGVFTVGGFYVVENWWETRARLDRAERDALARDKALAEAELRVLQAQVEPHFLFNTLANVISLIHTHPDRASRLLEQLTSLLRASLSRTRRAQGTLGEELEVVRAYLDIQALRMAGRMTWEVKVDAGLEAVPVPPLLVQPLVENAVLHGVEPSPAGGHVAVCAERRDGGVCIRVADDGVGLDPETAGHGIGIASVRERLRATFGDAARVSLSVAPGGGVRVELRIPAVAPAEARAG